MRIFKSSIALLMICIMTFSNFSYTYSIKGEELHSDSSVTSSEENDDDADNASSGDGEDETLEDDTAASDDEEKDTGDNNTDTESDNDTTGDDANDNNPDENIDDEDLPPFEEDDNLTTIYIEYFEYYDNFFAFDAGTVSLEDVLVDLPDSLDAVGIDGNTYTLEVTWDCPDFDPDPEEFTEYIFTAKMPDAYSLAEDCFPPQISVCILVEEPEVTAVAANIQVVYVHPSKGTSQDGSFAHPRRSIQAAYDAITTTGEIRLLGGLNLTGFIRMNKSISVTLISYDNTTNTPSATAHLITASTSMGRPASDEDSGLIRITGNNNTVTLRNISISAAAYNRVILVRDGAVLNIEGGTTLYQGDTNKASNVIGARDGGGVFVTDNGVINLNGGEISYNVGSGIYVAPTGIITMSNGSVVHNPNAIINAEKLNLRLQGNTSLITLTGQPTRPNWLPPTGITTVEIPQPNGHAVDFASGVSTVGGSLAFWETIFVPDRAGEHIRLNGDRLQLAVDSTRNSEPIPNASINFINERLINLTPNAVYTINGTDYTATSSGTIDIAATWFNSTISIVTKGTGTNINSHPQNLPIPARPAAPSQTLFSITHTSDGYNNGVISISDVNNAMQYRLNTVSSWTAVTTTPLTNLAAGTYNMRYSATSIAFASHDRSLNVENPFTPIRGTHFNTNNDPTTNDWLTADFFITALSVFEVSTSPDTWPSPASPITRSADTGNGSVTFYVKNTVTGNISSAVTVNYRIDKTQPTAQIRYKTSGLRSFINSVTFGLFFKNSVTITIAANDNLSGVSKIEYFKAPNSRGTPPGETIASGEWVTLTGTEITANANESFILYIRVTDNAGNERVYLDSGVVVYQDSAPIEHTINHTKYSGTKTVPLTLNGNTINSVRTGSTPLTVSTDYTLPASPTGIIFTSSYLDGLSVGSHIVRVSYNPMNHAFNNTDGNEAPSDTVITIIVSLPNIGGTASITCNLTGNYAIGETLTAVTNAITPSAAFGTGSFTYQWQTVTGGVVTDITGATNSTYVIRGADAGKTIRVVITHPNTVGQIMAATTNTVPFNIVILNSGQETVDTAATISSAWGREGAPITVNFVLGIHNVLGNNQNRRLTFEGATGLTFRELTASDITAITGPVIYTVNPGDAVNGVITIRATFVSTSLILRTLSFDSGNRTSTWDVGGYIYPATLSHSNDFPTESGMIQYTSSDPLIAEVGSGGIVTIKAVGETTITATIPIDSTNTYSAASATYTLTVNRASQSAPTTVGRTHLTSFGANDGTITGVTTAMEYRLPNTSAYIPVTGTPITGLPPGIYRVRYSQNDTHDVSPYVELEIIEPNQTFPVTVNVIGGTGGIGGGAYEQGMTVNITAGSPDSNRQFSHWSSNEIAIPNANNASTSFLMPAEAVTVTAHFTLKTYEVSFDSQSGSAVNKLTNVVHGETIYAPPNPVKTGWHFDGWYKEDTFNTPWDFASDTVTSNITLYAKWIDDIPPTGTMTIDTSTFKTFLNSATLGLFFTETVDVKIEGEDCGSGVASVAYLRSETPYGEDFIRDSSLSWTTITNGGTFSINPHWEGWIYARIIDNADNTTYIGSDGLVVNNILEIESITVLTPPTLVYNSGNRLDLSPLTVKAIYNHDIEKILLFDDPGLSFKVNGKVVSHDQQITTSVFDDRVIEVSYEGKTAETDKLIVYAPPAMWITVTKLTDSSADISYRVTPNHWLSDTESKLQKWEGGNWVDIAHHNGTYSGIHSQHSLIPNTDYQYRLWVIDERRTDNVKTTYEIPLSLRTHATASSGMDVSGNISDPKTIYLTVEHGNTVIAAATVDGNGIFDINFNGIPNGIYNLVADNGAFKVTNLITVNEEPVNGISINMTQEKAQSVVDIIGYQTPPAAVGELPQLFKNASVFSEQERNHILDGEMAEFKLVAQEMDESERKDDAIEIKKIAGNKDLGILLDFSLIKSKYCDFGGFLEDEYIEEIVGGYITIIAELPAHLKDKKGLDVYRVHKGTAELIPADSENAYGEFADFYDGYVALHVNRFSTYGIVYTDDDTPPLPPPTTPPTSPPGEGSQGGSSGDEDDSTKTTDKDDDATNDDDAGDSAEDSNNSTGSPGTGGSESPGSGSGDFTSTPSEQYRDATPSTDLPSDDTTQQPTTESNTATSPGIVNQTTEATETNEEEDDPPASPIVADTSTPPINGSTGSSDNDFDIGENLIPLASLKHDIEVLLRNIPPITFGGREILLFASLGADTWSLSNFILGCIVGVLFTAIIALRALLKRRRERNAELDLSKVYESKKLNLIWLALLISMGIIGAFLFLLIQDMSKVMVLFDLWTITHLIIIAVQILCLAIIIKRDKMKSNKNEV